MALTVDPELELACGDRIGGHLEYEFRDGDPLRTFYSRTVWSYEAYGYYKTEHLGTLKAGQVVTRFGIPWGGGRWFSDGVPFGVALVLATGLVVDDAIVVSENIMQRLEAGDSPEETMFA